MRVVPRSSRALAALLLPLLVATCTEEPIGPAGRVGFAQLAVHAEAPNAAQFAGLTIDFVQAVVTKPNATLDKLDTLANRTVPFPPDANTIQLGLTLLLSQAVDTVTLTLNYLSGATVLFSGSEQVEVRQGPAGANQVPTVPMTYIGPGTNVTTLDIQPRDTILTEGGSLQYRVTALDVQGASVPQFYVGWSSTGAGNVINAAGVLRAGTSRATFFIRAMTPESVWDSTQVSVVPAPASVQVQSGNGQTALISTALPQPLVVIVRGSDNLPVPGVPVAFAAATGGGSVDTAVVTTDNAGLAGTTVLLGATAGQQTFTATVQGRPAVTFTATAAPVVGPAVQLFIATAPSTTAASGVALLQQPVIQLRDAASQNVSQAGVAVTAAIATGGGVVTGTTVVNTNASGQAVFTNLVLSGIVGPRTLRFTAPSLASVTSGAITLGIGPPSTFLIQAGGGQSAISGTAVPIPPAVVVTDNGGNGVAGVNVTFAVATGGGTAVPTTPVVTLATGIATATSWTLGTTPGTNTLTATAPGVPGSPLTFTATGTSLTGPVTWNGSVSPDWSAAGNWTPALVPNNTRDVVIPTGPINMPRLTSSGSVRSLTVNTGATLDLNSINLQAVGNVFADGAIIGPGAVQISAAAQLRGTVPALILSSAVTVTGTTTATGNVTITGAGAVLNLNGQQMVVQSGAFATQGGGVLNMVNAADSLGVNGNATFGGGDETGRLTAGRMSLTGNFTQNTATTTFVGTGSHTLFLNGSGPQTLSFSSPGFAASHFQNVIIANTAGGVRTTSDLYSSGTTGVVPGVPRILAGNGNSLFTTILNVHNFTFDNLLINFTGSTVVSFDSVTFQNYAATATPLTIVHPGSVAPLAFDVIKFLSPLTTGFYLSAADNAPTDGVPLTINVTGSSPTTGAPFVQTAGGAVVNWPASSALVWTGSVSTDWSVAGNWSPARVPTNVDPVTIPATAQSPVLSARSVAGPVTITGGNLDLAGHTLDVSGDFATAGTGFLTMQLAADSLIVAGNTTFDGGGESGELTNGTLVAAGSFTQGSTTSQASFAASGSHTTVFNGTATQLISVPDTSLSFFHHLRIANNAVVDPQQVLQVQGDLTVGNNVTINATTPVANLPGFNVFGNVTAGTGGTLTASRLFVAGSLSVPGGYNVTFTTFTGAGQVAPLGLPYQTVTIYGTVTFAPGALAIGNNLVVSLGASSVTLNGPTTVGGAVFVDSGAVVVNGQSLTVTGGLTTQGTGTVTMQNALDAVTVGGSASFGGGDETGRLTAGTLTLAGDFTQANTTSGSSFQASGAHQTMLTGASPTVTFASPGSLAAQSRFAALTWTGTGTLTQGSGITVTGTYTTTATTPVTNRGLIAGGRFLQFATHTASGPIVFDNIRVIINQTGTGAPFALNNATFQGLTSTVTQLTIQHPGTGAPIALNNLVFSVLPTVGGLYLSATDNNTGDGQALVIDMVGANPASGVPFFITSGGATINWGSAPLRTWVGTTSAWTTASNWSPASVPTGTDDVTIPAGTPTSPTITANTAVRSLTVAAGASVDIPSAILTINGDVDVQGTVTVNALGGGFFLSGAGRTIRGTIENVNILGTYTVSGPLTISNDLIVQGTTPDGDLSVADQTVTVGRDLSLFSAGTVTMATAAGVMTIGRNANFMGGNTAGHLTAGRMDITGNLIQNNSGTGNPINSFSPSGSHVTRFIGSGARQISICTFCTGTGTGFSHFANLDLSQMTGPADLTQFDKVFVEGTLISNPAVAPPTLTTSNTAQLEVAGVNVNGLILDALPLTISGGAITAFNKVTLQGYLNTDIQLTVNHVGAATPFVFDQLTFSSPPTGAGRYLLATDADGPVPNALTIELTNVTPATDGGFTSANNGAVIHWPLSAPTVTWGGGIDNSWQNPANWSPAQVPTITDDVVIPNGTLNAPTLFGDAFVHNLTVAAPVNIDLITNNLNVSGDAQINGNIHGAGALVLAGGGTFSGSAENVVISAPMTLSGNTVMAGNLTVNAGTVNLNGHTLTVSSFNTTGTGTVTMTNVLDSLIVQGNATFGGGSTSGTMTAGVLRVTGDFLQASANSNQSFAASGTHKTVLGNFGTTAKFESLGGSVFQDLDITTPDGQVTFLSSSAVMGNLHNLGPGSLELDTTFMVVLGDAISVGGATVNSASGSGGMTLTGTGRTLAGDFTTVALLIGGSYTLTDTTDADIVSVSGGNLKINGQELTTGDLSIINGGTLTMINPQDSVFVLGDAIFDGGSTAGLLTEGAIVLDGNLFQGPASDPAAYAPSGNHSLILQGSAIQDLFFTNPGPSASHLQNVVVANTVGGVTVDTVYVLGQAAFAPTAPNIILGSGPGSRLVLSYLDVNGATFDNLQVQTPADGSVTFTQFDNVTFQNAQLDSFTQLQVTAPGGALAPVTLTFNNLTFTPLAAGNTGLYLDGTSSNGLGLNLVVNGSSVANGPAFSNPPNQQSANGVTVLWP